MNDTYELLQRLNIFTSKGKINPKNQKIIDKNPTIIGNIHRATYFLDEDTDIKTRIQVVFCRITERPTCKGKDCLNQTQFDKRMAPEQKLFQPFCCVKCSNSDPDKNERIMAIKFDKYGDNLQGIMEKSKKTVRQKNIDDPMRTKRIHEKTKQTNIERYGYANALMNDEVKQRKQSTNLERYGSINPLDNPEVNQKRLDTLMKNYGTTVPLKSDIIKQRQQNTMQDKYGSKHALCVDKFIQKKNDTSIERFGFDNPMKNQQIKQKQIETMLSLYGTQHALHVDAFLDKREATNNVRFNRNYHNQSHISQELLDNLSNYDWLYDQHVTQKKSMTEIAFEFHLDISTVCLKAKRLGIEVLKFGSSLAQKQVTDFIESLGVDVIINDRKQIHPKELDIYIPSHKLAIEYCGLYWHSEQLGRDHTYHSDKLKMCQQNGIRLITLFEDEWAGNQQIVQKTLMAILGIKDPIKTYARNTTIRPVTIQQKRDFFNSYHIQGDGPGSICYGLFDNTNTLVACMAFIKAPDKLFYLNRYATAHNVPGGFSKLLKHFKTNHQFNQIVSFADLRWSEGDTYFNNGFTLDKILAPDYSYSVDGHSRIHKFNFRHKNLPNMLHNYDCNLSERENCDNNGLLRLWDCGKMRFLMEN